eukprot:TRINITY_DN41682_c0_g1_i1.p1 TRINITY_DN41682_c0_g1~~TRINITY_DN41682_c0_g1_i1.p1  ORF type:complete len:497 (-),score=112.43 TRINITY_DN41682_c0_g1_i1:30-1520(-)
MEATMPPELPIPNVDSPRTKAAMRVLGVHPVDLEKQDVEAFGGSETRHLLMEKKRRVLVAQVTNLASKGPQGNTHPIEKGDYPIAPGPERNSSFMEQVIQKERENLERLQRMAQKDIQKTVITELEAKLELHKASKKQDEGAQRMRELQKQRNEQLALQRKEQEKRDQRSKEVRERNHRQVLEHCEELRAELSKKAERVAKNTQEIADSRVAGREAGAQKFIDNAVRVAKHEDSLLDRRFRMVDEIEEKHAKSQSRLFEAKGARASNKEAILEKEMQCREKVHKFWVEKQAEVDDKYRKAVQRGKDAQAFRRENHEKELKEFRVANQKARTAFESRYERVQNEHARELEHLKEIGEMKRTKSEAIFRSERPELLKAREEAENHMHLAASNRDRLRRAHHHAVEQQIDKLLSMRERVQVMEDAKAEADRRRMMVLRNTAIEQSHLADKVSRFKDAGAEKMIALLSSTELDPESAKRINEILGELNLPPLGGYAPADD